MGTPPEEPTLQAAPTLIKDSLPTYQLLPTNWPPLVYTTYLSCALEAISLVPDTPLVPRAKVTEVTNHTQGK